MWCLPARRTTSSTRRSTVSSIVSGPGCVSGQSGNQRIVRTPSRSRAAMSASTAGAFHVRRLASQCSGRDVVGAHEERGLAIALQETAGHAVGVALRRRCAERADGRALEGQAGGARAARSIVARTARPVFISSSTACPSPMPRMAWTCSTSDGSNGSSCHSTFRATDSGLAELKSVVGISGFWLANWSASLPRLVPCSRQNSAARRKTARSVLSGGVPVGGAPSVRRPLPNGEPLMMPTPVRRARGSSSRSRVSFRQ